MFKSCLDYAKRRPKPSAGTSLCFHSDVKFVFCFECGCNILASVAVEQVYNFAQVYSRFGGKLNSKIATTCWITR